MLLPFVCFNLADVISIYSHLLSPLCMDDFINESTAYRHYIISPAVESAAAATASTSSSTTTTATTNSSLSRPAWLMRESCQ